MDDHECDRILDRSGYRCSDASHVRFEDGHTFIRYDLYWYGHSGGRLGHVYRNYHGHDDPATSASTTRDKLHTHCITRDGESRRSLDAYLDDD